uniref:Uncharacterized protein n=1 Tax=Siphoviridae sp. ctTkm23 TaxID=2825522 RepID=A0A8S5TRN5_9CAUD|nr:MAG TPA: hypothetical protein [Siphoviridae sp. ctTkm23]
MCFCSTCSSSSTSKLLPAMRHLPRHPADRSPSGGRRRFLDAQSL